MPAAPARELARQNSNVCGAAAAARGALAFRDDGPSGVEFAHDSPLEQGGFEPSVPPAGAGLFATSGMEKPEFANDVAGSDRAGLAASLRRLVAHPTVEQHAQRGDETERLV
jgi:hypothetical protein